MILARRSLASVLVFASVLDAVATWHVLSTRTGRELNPVARAAIEAFGLGAPIVVRVIVGLVVAGVVLRMTVLAEDRTQRVLIWSFAVVATAWWLFIAVQNLQYV